MGEPQVAIEFNTKSGHNNVLDPWVSANFHQLKWLGFRNNRKWWDIDNHWYCIMKLKQHGFAWKSCAQNLDAVEPQFSTMKMAVSACANPPFLHQVPRWSCLDQFQPIFKSNLWAASPQETPRLSAINTSSRYCSYCSCGMLYFPWRIHGAGIYANIKGVYWWDPWHTIYTSTMDPMGFAVSNLVRSQKSSNFRSMTFPIKISQDFPLPCFITGG